MSMKRVLKVVLATALIATSMAPTLADDPPATTPATPFPKTGIKGKFESVGKFGKSLPKRLPPTLIGAVGGTPVMFWKTTVNATKEGVRDIVGDSKFPLFVAPAFCLSVPYAITAGVIAGPVVALAHGWKYSDDKPFSKESFSLGDDSK